LTITEILLVPESDNIAEIRRRNPVSPDSGRDIPARTAGSLPTGWDMARTAGFQRFWQIPASMQEFGQ
jgi:hypothetical protein